MLLSRAVSWAPVQSSGSPVPAVVRHFVVPFAICASLALVTAFAPMRAMGSVPELMFEASVVFVKADAASVPPAPIFSVEPSVPANWREFEKVTDFPEVIWKVHVVAEHESPMPFQDVPSAAPRVGVVSVGEVARTTAPEPVTPFERSEAAGWAQVRFPLAAMALANWLAEQSVGFAARAEAVEALPVSAAVIVEAVKFPEASRATIALAVFAGSAVVLALGRMPVTLAVRSIVELAIFAFVTARLAIVAAADPGPEAVTSPVSAVM
jgi:hypothetical protein